MNRRTATLIGGGASVLVIGLTIGLTVGHSSGSTSAANTRSLAVAQRVADSIVVPGLTPSSACTTGVTHCYADRRSVVASANAVFDAMQQQTHAGPRLRCFPHRVGVIPPGSLRDTRTLVDSCVVDVAVDGHLAYAVIDAVTSGPPSHLAVHGSTVQFQAN